MVNGLHRDHLIVPHFMVAVRYTHVNFVFLDLEFAFLAYRKQDGMFIQRAHVVLHIVGTEHVLRAEFFVRIHVRNPNRGPDAAQAGQSTLVCAARDSFHFLNHGTTSMFLPVARKSGKHKKEREHRDQWHVTIHLILRWLSAARCDYLPDREEGPPLNG